MTSSKDLHFCGLQLVPQDIPDLQVHLMFLNSCFLVFFWVHNNFYWANTTPFYLGHLLYNKLWINSYLIINSLETIIYQTLIYSKVLLEILHKHFMLIKVYQFSENWGMLRVKIVSIISFINKRLAHIFKSVLF